MTFALAPIPPSLESTALVPPPPPPAAAAIAVPSARTPSCCSVSHSYSLLFILAPHFRVDAILQTRKEVVDGGRRASSTPPPHRPPPPSLTHPPMTPAPSPPLHLALSVCVHVRGGVIAVGGLWCVGGGGAGGGGAAAGATTAAATATGAERVVVAAWWPW